MHPMISGLFFQAIVLPAALIASPIITIDTLVYDVGTIEEGQITIIKHAFKIKNDGDSVMAIHSVKSD